MATPIHALSGMGSASMAALGSTGGGAPTPSAANAAPFSDLLTGALGQVDTLQAHAEAAMNGLITGAGVDVHTAMIATQKASMAFELSLAVRNKAVQAYQQIMGMQF